MSADRPPTSRTEIQSFVRSQLQPCADAIDADQSIPRRVIGAMGTEGYWGARVPAEFGGRPLDATAFGALAEALGAASASLLSVFTVHSMVCESILRWGTREQKAAWLPSLASGETLGAFALSEPGVGSDAANVQTEAVHSADGYALTGRKKWISAGQIAGLFLVVARNDRGPIALLVERKSSGLEIQPISGMSGFRGAMLGELTFDSCRVPQENLLCREGMGFSHVAGTALDLGRFCIAAGCAGLANAASECAVAYARERKQFDRPICEFQLVQQLIADLAVDVRAAQRMWMHAAMLRESADPNSISETAMAKYFAARTAVAASNHCLQIHGAAGLPEGSNVARYWRDARIMELIEGSTQMQQLMIAEAAIQASARGEI